MWILIGGYCLCVYLIVGYLYSDRLNGPLGYWFVKKNADSLAPWEEYGQRRKDQRLARAESVRRHVLGESIVMGLGLGVLGPIGVGMVWLSTGFGRSGFWNDKKEVP